jgi:hypothetical protein
VEWLDDVFIVVVVPVGNVVLVVVLGFVWVRALILRVVFRE